MNSEQITADFIARMDAKPPEERVPNWETTKALMLREAPKIGHGYKRAPREDRIFHDEDAPGRIRGRVGAHAFSSMARR